MEYGIAVASNVGAWKTVKRAGYDHFVVQLLPGHESAIDDWAHLFDKA